MKPSSYPIEQLKQILVCAMLANGEPLSIERMSVLFPEGNQPSHPEIKQALDGIAPELSLQGLTLKETASGYCLQIIADLHPFIMRLFEKRPAKYSRALLETLALIAYRQPITRAEIEDVRGVAVSSHLFKILMEREWIRSIGHKDVPGKPALYATTKQFLDYFNLKSLQELPSLINFTSTDLLPEEAKDSHQETHADPEEEPLEEILTDSHEESLQEVPEEEFA
jgi:segregation and condensation protein B